MNILLEYRNGILAVATFIVSLILAYYKIQDYRELQATVKILHVDATYFGRKRDKYSSPTTDPDADGLDRTAYVLTVEMENDGRENATVSDVRLILPDTEEELELANSYGQADQISKPVRLDDNDRQEVKYGGNGKIRDNYSEEIPAILRLDTTAGTVEHELMLQSQE